MKEHVNSVEGDIVRPVPAGRRSELAEGYQSIRALERPLTDDEMTQIAAEEHEQEFARQDWRCRRLELSRALGKEARMPTLTVIEDYIVKAIQRARFEHIEDGTIAAWIPECPGVQAFGADLREVLSDLSDRLDEWVQLSLAQGSRLPTLDGLDLNANGAAHAAANHKPADRDEQPMFFENEAEFEDALSQLDEA